MSTWIPKEKRNNLWYLFHNLYSVRVNELAIRPIDHVKDYGVLVSGDKDHDRGAKKREIMCMMKIPEMADHHSNGVGIYLVNGSDSIAIYKIIEQHLSMWIDYLNHEFGVGDAPIEDLQKLDKLANVLYPIRCRNTPAGETVHSFERALRNVLGNRTIIKTPNPEKKKVGEEGPKRGDGFGKLLNEYKTVQDYRRM